MHIFALVYIILCWLIGAWGSNRRMGFWGFFFGSLLLTPVFGLLHILVTEPRPRPGTTRA